MYFCIGRAGKTKGRVAKLRAFGVENVKFLYAKLRSFGATNNRFFCAKRPTHVCVVSVLKPSTNVAKTPPRGREIVGLGQRFASELCATVFFRKCHHGCGKYAIERVAFYKKQCKVQQNKSAPRLQRKLARHCCARAQGVGILPFPLGKKKKFLNLLKKCAQLCLQIFNYVV